MWLCLASSVIKWKVGSLLGKKCTTSVIARNAKQQWLACRHFITVSYVIPFIAFLIKSLQRQQTTDEGKVGIKFRSSRNLL